jgi:hypothetical protein
MEMKKTILYAVLLCATTGILFSSCEEMFGDFLDKQPSNELTEAQVFSDWNTAEQFHLDTYNFLRHGAGRINNTWLDATTDLAGTSFSAGVKLSFNIGNYYSTSGAPELTATWEHFYRGIRKCNVILTRIDSVPKDPTDSEEKYEIDKANYKSEARFLRAYFYWELFKCYGPVPIVKEVLDPDGDLLSDYKERPSIREYVVNFILRELWDCESGLMNYDDGAKAANAGRISQPMARALYSRIMLYMASPYYSAASGVTWSEAATASRSFIETYGNNYRLFTTTDATGTAYANTILRTTYQGNNTETIIFRNDVQAGWSNIINDTPVGEGGNGGLCPSQNLVDMYDMANGASPFTEYDATGAPVYTGVSTPAVDAACGYADATMWENRDPRLSSTVLYHGATWGNGAIDVIKGRRDNPIGNANATPTGYYVCKYIPENILSNVHSGTGYRNWIIMRYAEVLLNYAEAVNEVQGPCTEVYDCLDQIRNRGGITGKVADRADLNTKDAMRNFIHKERTVELAFEEHRMWDVRRWDVAVEALSRPIYGVEVAADGSITRKIAQERVFEDKMYLYPIPETEVWKTDIENNTEW